MPHTEKTFVEKENFLYELQKDCYKSSKNDFTDGKNKTDSVLVSD